MIYAVTGSPGTGKHTISNMISKSLNLPLLDISAEASRLGMLEHDTVDTSRLAHALECSESCIIVGHLAPYVLGRNFVDTILVLRRSPYELEGIYHTRGYDNYKTKENLGAEILGVIAQDSVTIFGKKVTQLDVTGHTINYNYNRALTLLRDPDHSDTVDWLDMIHRNNDMRRFFDYSTGIT